MLRFSDIHQASEGMLASLLMQAYAVLLKDDAAPWKRECRSWSEFDRAAYSSSEIGDCVFLTWFGDATVGFGSFDPRDAPRSARVGHNCIVPPFQGRGFGRQQLDEIMRRIRARRIIEIHAATLDLPFFLLAQRMYDAAGFRVVERTPWNADPRVSLLHYSTTPAKQP